MLDEVSHDIVVDHSFGFNEHTIYLKHVKKEFKDYIKLGMEDTISVINIPEFFPQKESEDEFKTGSKKETKIVSNSVSYWSFLYILVILVVCLLATSVVTLIPRHNTIFYPEYWYEPMVLFILTAGLRFSLATIAEFYIFTKVEELLSVKTFLKVFLGYSLSFALPYCISYTIWTVYFEQNHPLPFNGLCGFSVNLASIAAVWYLFPPAIRARAEIKEKIPFMILFRLVWLVSPFVSYGLIIAIAILSHMDWVSAFLIPIVRSSKTWIAYKITSKITGATNEAANLFVSLSIAWDFGIFKAIKLFNVSQFTVYCILFVELILHMRTCYQIIKLSRKVNEETTTAMKENIDQEKRTTFFDLLITELIDAMIPLVYGIGYAMAYFGPNAHLMRNVGSDWFGGKIMTDLQNFYIFMLELLTIDLISAILTVASLYHFCNLHVLQEISKLLKKYWWLMMLQLCIVVVNFGSNDINFAIDFTGEFLWTTDDGRYELIRNSSKLSQNEKAMLLPNFTQT